MAFILHLFHCSFYIKVWFHGHEQKMRSFDETESSNQYLQSDASPAIGDEGEHLTSQLSYEKKKKKKNSYFPLYWLVNRDPYNGSL